MTRKCQLAIGFSMLPVIRIHGNSIGGHVALESKLRSCHKSWIMSMIRLLFCCRMFSLGTRCETDISSRSSAVFSGHTQPCIFKFFWRYDTLPLASTPGELRYEGHNPSGLHLTVRLWSSMKSQLGKDSLVRSRSNIRTVCLTRPPPWFGHDSKRFGV